MKQIIFTILVCITVSATAQTTIKIKDTSFTFSSTCYYGGLSQAYDHSIDSYYAEVQNDKYVIVFSNDESTYSLRGYVFFLNTIDKEALKKDQGIGGVGVGLNIKGKARTFTLDGASTTYQDESFTLGFATAELRKAYLLKTFKIKL